MKNNAPFILILLGISFIWLGLTGRLGAVLAAIFEPGILSPTSGGGSPVVVPTPEGNTPKAPEKATPEKTAPEESAPKSPETPELPKIQGGEDFFPGADIFPFPAA